MDADLQHDESILPELLRTIREEGVDVVVASRNVAGGSMGEFAKQRVAVSDLGRSLSRMICRCEITDPMSGFFILDRRFLEEVAPHVSAIGFKVLVDLISSSQRPVRLAEVPYRFRERLHGESKLDTLVLVEYLLLVVDKLIGNWIPPRFVLFGLVGLVGAAVYMALLFLLYRTAQFDFRFSLVMATTAAMILNFLLNNVITYRDRRLKGGALLGGLLTFCLACSVGAVVAIRISELTQRAGLHWFLAGAVGVLIASVWNFTITQFFTWRLGHRSRITRRRPSGVN
jgi:dolichol-phosphate mannosyltransferase